MRPDADKVYVRESQYGPELVLDYGVHGVVVNLTENEADRAEQALRQRRETREMTSQPAPERELVDWMTEIRLTEGIKRPVGPDILETGDDPA